MPQMFNGYNFNPYQQYQQPIQNFASSLPGRIVEDISQVGANEVPMDGSKAVFMKNDGSILYVKQWNSNGSISTIAYKPYLDTKSTLDEQVTTKELELKFDTLKTQIDNIENMLTKMSGKKVTKNEQCADAN